jgi:hypothetical protein
MAETAPLTSVGIIRSPTISSSGLIFKQALTHARKAARSSIDTDWSEAIAEHQQAAADYSRTARTTNDSEVSHKMPMLENDQA